MKLKQDGFLAKCLGIVVEYERRKNRERPMMPFVNEKKQMWYFLMNQMDDKSPEDGGDEGETQS